MRAARCVRIGNGCGPPAFAEVTLLGAGNIIAPNALTDKNLLFCHPAGY